MVPIPDPRSPIPDLRNAIAFFSDRAMIPGLHAALLSLAQTNQELDADVFVFADGLTENDAALLQKTWSMGKSKNSLFVRQFKPTSLGGTLYGNSTTWGRVFLGELLPEYQKCVYLDCDLIVNTSLQPLFDLLTGEVLLSADCSSDREWSLEKELFVHTGIGLVGKCFNAGVLAMNLAVWRESAAFAHCQKTSELYASVFPTADQSLLNVAFHDRVVAFGEKYNTPLYPYALSIALPGENIYHFVGSPKPWDLFGSALHNNYSIWQSIFIQTAIGGEPAWHYLSLQRVLKTGKQVIKAWTEVRKQR